MCPTSIDRKNYSYVWHSLMKVWKSFQDGLIWSIRSGRSVSFIKDEWLPEVEVLLNHLHPNNDISPLMKVVDFVDDANYWKWSTMSSMFDKDILEFIVVCHPPKE